MKPLSFFFVHQLQAMFLGLHNTSSQTMLLNTDGGDKTLNITENKTLHHGHFIPEILIKFGATTFVFLDIFS